MNLRHAIITFIVCLISCPTLAGVISLWRHTWTLSDFASAYIYVSMAVGILGALASFGASSGGGERSVDSVSISREEYRRLDAEDAARGIGFGWVLFLAGALSFAGGYCLSRLAEA